METDKHLNDISLPLQPSLSALVLDTGATGHFVSHHHTTSGPSPAEPITVKLPDASTITSASTTTLPLPTLQPLPPKATTAHIFPQIQNSLVSVGKLCDTGCTAHFDKHSAIIRFNNKPVLTATCQPNGLWTCLPFFKSTPSANNMERISHRIKDHVAFLHAACFSTVAST